MPFRKSARVELVYDGPSSPATNLWNMMPCYSYVMYREIGQHRRDAAATSTPTGARKTLLLGRQKYTASRGEGQGKVRRLERHRSPAGKPESPAEGGYPVDENEKFSH